MKGLCLLMCKFKLIIKKYVEYDRHNFLNY